MAEDDTDEEKKRFLSNDVVDANCCRYGHKRRILSP